MDNQSHRFVMNIWKSKTFFLISWLSRQSLQDWRSHWCHGFWLNQHHSISQSAPSEKRFASRFQGWYLGDRA